MSSLQRKHRYLAAFALVFSALIRSPAQTPEELSPLSPDLTDSNLVEFSKAEIRFAQSAVPLVQSRICQYAEAAKTSHGQPLISELMLPRAIVPPRSFCLTNAISAARLYLDFTTPPELAAGDAGAAWTELGFAVLERANSVLHHYYLAPEYRKGHEPALLKLRELTRNLAAGLSKRGGVGDRLAEVKARYAALWFEKCDEVLPIYAEVIGNGARGVVRDALVLRPMDLPLFTGWTWEERRRANKVQREFIERLCASSEGTIRIEGELLRLARTRTDRAYIAAFTKVMDAIERDAKFEGTRTAYANVIKELLDDRHSKDLTEKTRNELREIYEARFLAQIQKPTNAPSATVPGNLAQATPTKGTDPLKTSRPPSTTKSTAIPVRAKTPPSWQLLMVEADIRYWETMPLPEIRSLAAKGDALANYYVYLKLRNSDAPGAREESDAALEVAYKAGLPQAELDYADRLTNAEERFYWTEKSAKTGYPAAQLALGKLYILGHGISIDLERGLSLVRATYDLKVPDAEAVLADLYASGIGNPRNVQERPEILFVTAARNNQPAAMLELHHRYLEGYGVSRDPLEACRWLVNVGLHDKSALSKYLDDTGKALPQPSDELDRFAKTLAVYAQAVVHKQPEAISHVADWYANGSIGRKSPLRAYALLSLAQDSEKITPDTIERVKAALTPQQLKTAELLTSQWQRIQPDLL